MYYLGLISKATTRHSVLHVRGFPWQHQSARSAMDNPACSIGSVCAQRSDVTSAPPQRGRLNTGRASWLWRDMADPELEAIRKQRLAELQGRHAEGGGEQSRQEAKQREDEMRNNILAQVLSQEARARLNNLALVKPEKAKSVENYLIQMARFGQLGSKLSEQGLIEILEKVSQQTEKKMTVKSRLEGQRIPLLTLHWPLRGGRSCRSLRFPDGVNAWKSFNRRKVMDSDEEDD
uniref:Programmed cell death protein 5 n=1 Tax=Leptobrachium leishanense TaxID=445787 RepID=A0A8C5PWJ8_9ANUR